MQYFFSSAPMPYLIGAHKSLLEVQYNYFICNNQIGADNYCTQGTILNIFYFRTFCSIVGGKIQNRANFLNRNILGEF